MVNNTDLNKLQDLFQRLPEPQQDIIFQLITYLLPVNELPKGRNVFDLIEQEDSVEKLKQTGFVKVNQLDNFEIKEEPVKIISKQEASDIEDFNITASTPAPEKKKRKGKEPVKEKRKRAKSALNDAAVIKIMRKSGNKEENNILKATLSLNPNMETIDSLYTKYCRDYGEGKALEMSWTIVPRAKEIQAEAIANESVVGKKAAWDPIFEKARELNYPREKGIAYLGACVVIAANELGFPI